MPTSTPRPAAPKGRLQAPLRKEPPRSSRRIRFAVTGALALIGVVVATVLLTTGGSSGSAGLLPSTSDYHSLLVADDDPERLVLGTHQGLFRSDDGGRSWSPAGLPGRDAMNLARAPAGATVWSAGHDVLAKSTDGGETWVDVRPDGLPGLDVHGFAVDPREGTLYAAIAGRGLYRSRDGGRSFGLASSQVGGGVMALAVSSSGRLLAGDMQRGLLASDDGGKSWTRTLEAQVMGLAVDPGEPQRVVATGPGILLSTDGGRSWRRVLELDEGAGPVAWAPSDPETAYAVGFDRSLYTTSDGGESWRAVGGGG